MGSSSKSMLLPFNMPPVAKGGMLGMLQSAGGGGGAANNWYAELARKTLTDGEASVVQTEQFTTTENLMYLASFEGTGTSDAFLEFNDNASADYSNVYDRDGTVSRDTNQALGLRLAQGTTDPMFSYGYIRNISDDTKLVMGYTIEENGTGNTEPDCQLYSGKWNITDEQINQLALTRASDNFENDSQIVALGTNYDGQSNNNYWELLGSAKTTGGASSLEVTSLANKRYYWIQFYCEASTDLVCQLSESDTFDTGTNYNQRYVYNGSYSGSTGRSNLEMTQSADCYSNMLICNISGKPKLIINNSALQNIANTQNDKITFGKWTETEVMDGFRVFKSGQTLDANSMMTVWGHD